MNYTARSCIERERKRGRSGKRKEEFGFLFQKMNHIIKPVLIRKPKIKQDVLYGYNFHLFEITVINIFAPPLIYA